MAILSDFTAKYVSRDKQGYFQHDRVVNSSRGHNNPNCYAQNNRASKYMKQKWKENRQIHNYN